VAKRIGGVKDIKDKEAREVIRELELKVEWLKEVLILLKEHKIADAKSKDPYIWEYFPSYRKTNSWK
jgi:hypothetical protein